MYAPDFSLCYLENNWNRLNTSLRAALYSEDKLFLSKYYEIELTYS